MDGLERWDEAIRVDPFPEQAALEALWQQARGGPSGQDFARVHRNSLVHLAVEADGHVIGYVNFAWDGGVHVFVLNPMVDPRWRGRGLGRQLVQRGLEVAGERGAHWAHVDYEPHLAGFYASCGYRASPAGVMRIGSN